ncbi:MAG TPA: hypothetical protein VEY95_17310 [Azospirillaceae bacterium]|nr:hypothetical protein [Azospirillaceae bacterium]
MRCIVLAAALAAIPFSVPAQPAPVPAVGSPLARSVAIGQPVQVGDLPPAPVAHDWRPAIIVVHGRDDPDDGRGSFASFSLGIHGFEFGFAAGPHPNIAGLHRR